MGRKVRNRATGQEFQAHYKCLDDLLPGDEFDVSTVVDKSIVVFNGDILEFDGKKAYAAEVQIKGWSICYWVFRCRLMGTWL
jgi:hypothetical protein